jgi:hypothetical protein
MRSSYKGLFICIVLLLLVIGSVFAASQGWVFKIKFGESAQTTVSGNDFYNSFASYIDLQGQFSEIPAGLLIKIKKSKAKQKEFGQLLLSQLLIEQYLKERRLVNMAAIDAKAKKMTSVLKNMIIVKEFVKKVIDPKVPAVTNEDVKNFYNENKRRPDFRKRVRGLNLTQIREMIKNYLFRKRKSVLLQKYITRLKERAVIKTNEGYFN